MQEIARLRWWRRRQSVTDATLDVTVVAFRTRGFFTLSFFDCQPHARSRAATPGALHFLTYAVCLIRVAGSSLGRGWRRVVRCTVTESDVDSGTQSKISKNGRRRIPDTPYKVVITGSTKGTFCKI